MSFQRLIIETNQTAASFKSACNLAMGGLDAAQSFQNYVAATQGGNESAKYSFQVGAVKATATITSAGAATAAQAMTLLNVTLTAIASNPGQNQFVPSATVGTQAANIAAAINASTALAGKVTATSNAGVVTVTSVVPGLMGNGFQISAGDLSNVTVGAFANGTDGTSYVVNLL